MFDPESGVEMLCRLCFGTGKEPIETKLKADMHKELAQYVAPKRKAIEHSGQGGGPVMGMIMMPPKLQP